MCTIPLMRHVCRESYNQPLEVYEKLKRLGMDLVTVTDHDSIDAVEALRSRADFFLSEEVTCTLPSGSQLHVGVYDITERDHIELQRRRNDFESLLAWLVDQDLFFSANHVFSSLTGRRSIEDFRLFETAFPALETLNGHMLAERQCQCGMDGGSSLPAPKSAAVTRTPWRAWGVRGPWSPAREIARNICRDCGAAWDVSAGRPAAIESSCGTCSRSAAKWYAKTPRPCPLPRWDGWFRSYCCTIPSGRQFLHAGGWHDICNPVR